MLLRHQLKDLGHFIGDNPLDSMISPWSEPQILKIGKSPARKGAKLGVATWGVGTDESLPELGGQNPAFHNLHVSSKPGMSKLQLHN